MRSIEHAMVENGSFPSQRRLPLGDEIFLDHVGHFVRNPQSANRALTRVEHGEMPEGRIQILTHRTEHAVWQPRWLSHPNGALALAGITIAVADIEEAAQRFVRFTGRAAQPAALGQTIALDRGTI